MLFKKAYVYQKRQQIFFHKENLLTIAKENYLAISKALLTKHKKEFNF